MTDQLPDWDHPGDPLQRAALHAQVQDLRLHYRLGGPDFLAMLLNFYADCLEEGCWPEAILALLEADRTDLDAAADPALTLARMTSSRDLAREVAAEELAWKI